MYDASDCHEDEKRLFTSSTADVNEPWNGQINGNYVPQGVYAYYVAVFNGAGKKFEERGTVTFLCCP